MPIKKILSLCVSFAAVLAAAALGLAPVEGAPADKVYLIQLNDDTINPVTAEYISQGIDKATQDNVQCLIIKLDTPGGLLSSTRTIVKKMLTAKVPVVVYIAPSGSRAGSAGVFITYASHVAAMAPSTNIGAAHPVEIGRQDPQRDGDWGELRKLIEELRQGEDITAEKTDENSQEEPQASADPMEDKIMQDTLAFIRSIAQARGRNVEWALESVSQSSSITSDEALAQNVVEIIARDEQDLLEQLDGRTVLIDEGERALKTKGASIETIAMDKRQMFFNILANPNIAYILMILGFYGMLYEITHPGFGVPGVLGAVFLILAFYSMQTLPTNYAGLALLVLGLVLLVAEAYSTSFGLLALGGVACLVLGSLLLFESADPIMRVSYAAIFAFAASAVVFTLVLLRAIIKFRKKKPRGGADGLGGEIGVARENLSPQYPGRVFVHGELWNAYSNEKINKGERVRVINVNGLNLNVEKFKEE